MEKKTILILGATGMAGHMMYLVLSKINRYKIINVVYRNKLNNDSIIVDVTQKAKLDDVIATNKPDIIINCVGVLIKGSKEDPYNTVLINAGLPHLLSSLAQKYRSKVIHLSTDCVFSGKKGAYSETDYRDADDIYGRSKALGELNNERDLTIRTSIIGPEIKKNGEGLFHWFMSQNGEIFGYEKVYWSGVTTLELATAVTYFIDNDCTGLINLTNGLKISKFNLLKLFNEHLKEIYKLNIKKENFKKSDKSLVSVRNNCELDVSSYEKMIDDLFIHIKQNTGIYNKFYDLHKIF